MRMRGKLPIFSYRDTFNLTDVFSKLIYHGLAKYREALLNEDNKPYFGFPAFDDDIKSVDDWLEIIETMMYGFDERNYPNGSDYNFKSTVSRTEGFKIENREEYERYCRDCDKFEEAKEKSIKLFAKYYGTLWW